MTNERGSASWRQSRYLYGAISVYVLFSLFTGVLIIVNAF